MRLFGDGDARSFLWMGEFKNENKLAKKISNKVMNIVK